MSNVRFNDESIQPIILAVNSKMRYNFEKKKYKMRQ